MASFFTKSLCSLFRGARTSIPTITKYSAAPITRWTPFSAVRAFHSSKSAALFDPLDLAENGYSPCMSLLALARAEQQQRQTAPPAKSSYTTSKPKQEEDVQTKSETKQVNSTNHLEELDYSRHEDAHSEQLFSDNDDEHSFLGSSYSPSFASSYSTASPDFNFAPSRSSTPLSIAEHTNAEPFSPIICPVARRPQESFTSILDIDLNEIPSSPSPTSEASFEDLTPSIRLVSNSPLCPLFSSPSPVSDSDDGYTPIDYSPTTTTTPSERWSLTEVERAERGQASIIYEEEHLVGASKFYAPHLEVPRAKRVGGWGMPAWAEWSEAQVEAWAREEGI